MTVSKTYGAAVKKYLLIPVAVLAVGVVLLAAEAGKNDPAKVFSSEKAATAAVGDDDLQIEILQTRFCRDAHRHGDAYCMQEIVGRVVSTGKKAHGFRIGECVGFSGRATPCGKCVDCRANRTELCRYAGWVCEVGCDRHLEGCRNRIVVSHRHVIALSDEEAQDPFPHLCGKSGYCPQLYCHDSADNASWGRRCGHGRGRHCR